jgi:hypothetical protein
LWSRPSACALPMSYYRRYLPHYHPPEAILFLTWRLFGSVPRNAITSRFEICRQLPDGSRVPLRDQPINCRAGPESHFGSMSLTITVFGVPRNGIRSFDT